MQENSISINCLCKDRKGRAVLKDANLRTKQGGYFRRVQTPCAGKTEPIKSLLNFRRPNHHIDQIFDVKRGVSPARQQLSCLPERFIGNPCACRESRAPDGAFVEAIDTEAGRHAAA